jgi:hypothetical protein
MMFICQNYTVIVGLPSKEIHYCAPIKVQITRSMSSVVHELSTIAYQLVRYPPFF